MKINHRVVVTLPHPSFRGGVGHIFKVLQLNTIDDIRYLYITQQGKSANPVFFIRMICVFIKAIWKANLIHLNPSLDFKSIVRDGILLTIARMLGKRTLVFMHGWDDNFQTKIHRNPFFKKLFSLVFNRADYYILLGEIFTSKMKELGVKDFRIEYFPTLADDTHFTSLPAADFSSLKVIRLFFIAGHHTSKGIDIIINTMRILNQDSSGRTYILTIAGEGPDRAKWEQYVKDNNISNVNFVGHVAGKVKHQHFCDSDFLFFPSYYAEGLPCAIMEGMLYGLIIITRPIGGIPYWVRHNENGWLSESYDPKDFADGIRELLNNPELLSAIRSANNSVAMKYFTPDKMRENLLRVYQKLTNDTFQSKG